MGAAPLATPPHSDLQIDSALPPNELHPAIKHACRQLLPGWEALHDDIIEVSLISGGISNALYKVAPSAGAAAAAGGLAEPPPPVVFRVYGANTEKFVDREKEVLLMVLLHAHGFGPELLATFANGRIESFLPLRCLRPEEMSSPAVAPAVAAALARFHAVPVPGDKSAGAHPPATPFARTREWLAVARGLDFSDDPVKLSAFRAFDFDRLAAEVGAVEAAAAAACSPTVFAHNDLLSGNIMVPPDFPCAGGGGGGGGGGAENGGAHAGQQAAAAGMTFIDFEYAGWAPRGFDWGNHFCEYAGFEGDYSRYPGPEAAARFVRAYLAAAGGVAEAQVADAAVAAAVAEANVFALASHQYWGAWAIMQARWSAIDFDYMGYAALRWSEYWRRRDEFLAGAAGAAAAAAADPVAQR